MPSTPNILYFVTHDTGRFLGCYDRPIPFSPNLDAFARDAVLFRQAFCSAPCCGPSRNCAMTGKYSHVTGTLGLGGMGWTLPKEIPTTVDFLNDANYETAHFGFCHERLYGEMRYQIDGAEDHNKHFWKCDTRLAVNHAIDYLRNRDASRPFYLNIATNETHASHLSGVHTERHGGPVPEDQCWIPPTEPDCPITRQRWAHWYASLQYMDHHFGRLLSALEELGIKEETLIIYTTDHGTGCQRGKRHVYEPGVEIALIVRPPGDRHRGYQVDHLIPNIDFLPTLLEAAGVQPPDDLNGRSFWPLLDGQPYQPNDHLFIERNFHGERDDVERSEYIDFYDPQRAVRTRDFSYIRHLQPAKRQRPWYAHEMTGFRISGSGDGQPLPRETEPRPEIELYDLRHDPWEQHNVANRPEYDKVQIQLDADLLRWMETTDDPGLHPGIPEPLDHPVQWPIPGKIIEVARR